MAKLENVIIEFKCKHCDKITEMSAQDLMEAGSGGAPCCDCAFEEYDLNVLRVYMMFDMRGKNEFFSNDR